MTKTEFITICDTSIYISFLFYEKSGEKYIVYLGGKWKEPVLTYYKQIIVVNTKSDAIAYIEKYANIIKNHNKYIEKLTIGKMK